MCKRKQKQPAASQEAFEFADYARSRSCPASTTKTLGDSSDHSDDERQVKRKGKVSRRGESDSSDDGRPKSKGRKGEDKRKAASGSSEDGGPEWPLFDGPKSKQDKAARIQADEENRQANSPSTCSDSIYHSEKKTKEQASSALNL